MKLSTKFSLYILMTVLATLNALGQLTYTRSVFSGTYVAIDTANGATDGDTTTKGAGTSNRVSIDLHLGLFTGLRVAILPYSDENLTVAVEGFYGSLALLFGTAYGGGVRVQYRVASVTSNALLISPGVNVYFSPPSGGFIFGHTDNQVYVLANADISWLHEFTSHFGFELGARLGGGFELSSQPLPQFELFTGVRF